MFWILVLKYKTLGFFVENPEDLNLLEEKKVDENSHHLSNIFQTQPFQTQRSLTIGEDTHIFDIEGTQKKKVPEAVVEEQKVNSSPQMDAPGSFNGHLRRKCLDNITKEELKKLKLTVESSKEDKPVFIDLKPQRKYLVETKVKAIELCKKVGTLKVAASTLIPESTLRRWQKDGVNRVGKSGRGPKYEELESELFEKFMSCRSEGVSINNQFLLKEARLIARKKGIDDFLGTIAGLTE